MGVDAAAIVAAAFELPRYLLGQAVCPMTYKVDLSREMARPSIRSLLVRCGDVLVIRERSYVNASAHFGLTAEAVDHDDRYAHEVDEVSRRCQGAIITWHTKTLEKAKYLKVVRVSQVRNKNKRRNSQHRIKKICQ